MKLLSFLKDLLICIVTFPLLLIIFIIYVIPMVTLDIIKEKINGD